MKQKQNELEVLFFSQTFGLTWSHFSLITQAQNFWKSSQDTTSAALSLSSAVQEAEIRAVIVSSSEAARKESLHQKN
jgi:hypothetical protein